MAHHRAQYRIPEHHAFVLTNTIGKPLEKANIGKRPKDLLAKTAAPRCCSLRTSIRKSCRKFWGIPRSRRRWICIAMCCHMCGARPPPSWIGCLRRMIE